MSRDAFLELCWEIEKLPASEQQTKCSVMASELRRDYTMVHSAIRQQVLADAHAAVEKQWENNDGAAYNNAVMACRNAIRRLMEEK